MLDLSLSDFFLGSGFYVYCNSTEHVLGMSPFYSQANEKLRRNLDDRLVGIHPAVDWVGVIVIFFFTME